MQETIVLKNNTIYSLNDYYPSLYVISDNNLKKK